MSDIVLQERRTLDDVLKTGVRTYRNGCNYRLLKNADNKYYLEYGCDGVFINLITGDDKLLWKWFEKNNRNGIVQISSIVSPETIKHLLSQKPCEVCGGVY